LLLGCLSACGEGSPQTSSSTHFVRCETDLDCENLPMMATCGSEGYCVDGSGSAVELLVSYQTEFDGDALDSAVFGFETGFALRNADDQFYTDRAENAFLQDGELVLVARAESYDMAQYTSASIETRGKRAFRYGRIEAEILLPSGTGVGPAFWMLPEAPGAAERTCVDGSCIESTWPVWGDIVIMSFRSEDPLGVLSGTNYATGTAGNLLHAQAITRTELGPDTAGTYHVYRLDWGPERINWFIDDEPVNTFDVSDPAIYHPQGSNPFHQAFHLKLHLSVGGLAEAPAPEDYPQEMRVRWLRISQYE
jgi:beta-glucanase (GH16 family)